MRKEISYGIIPIRRGSHGWEVLMVQLHAGHWGFPKGHANKGEEPLSAAKRELLEETGLTVHKVIIENAFVEDYHFFSNSQKVHKKVFYFLAEVIGNPVIQLSELQALQWIPLSKAVDHATYPATQQICRDIEPLMPV
jgi:8-oxo-dGTP pyrophosphatase MutT (NUDIX family)